MQVFSVITLTRGLVVLPLVPAVPFRKPKGVPVPLGVGVHTVVGAVEVPVPLGVGVALPPVEPDVTVTVNAPTETLAPLALGWADDWKLNVTAELPVSLAPIVRRATMQYVG